MEKLDSTLFDWQTWRAGSLIDLGYFNRRHSIEEGRTILKRHAIGYCKGEHLMCRPKVNCYAVMFYCDGKKFWTHLTADEFERIL